MSTHQWDQGEIESVLLTVRSLTGGRREGRGLQCASTQFQPVVTKSASLRSPALQSGILLNGVTVSAVPDQRGSLTCSESRVYQSTQEWPPNLGLSFENNLSAFHNTVFACCYCGSSLQCLPYWSRWVLRRKSWLGLFWMDSSGPGLAGTVLGCHSGLVALENGTEWGGILGRTPSLRLYIGHYLGWDREASP